MSASDIFDVIQTEKQSSVDEPPFLDKQWVRLPDQQFGQYGSNRVTFDLSSLFSASQYYNWQDAYLSIPIVNVLSVSNNGTAITTDLSLNNLYSMGMKAGYYQIFDSVSLSIDDRTIVNHATHKVPFYTSFKLVTSMSTDDLNTIAPQIGYARDSATSWTYNAAASASGIGQCNNSGLMTATTVGGGAVSAAGTFGEAYNRGMEQRTSFIAQSPASTRWQSIYGNSSAIVESVFKTQGKSYSKVVQNGATAVNSYVVQYIFAQVRLRDILAVFADLPCTHGLNAKLELLTNCFTQQITIANNTNMSTSNAQTQSPYGMTPLMVASAAVAATPPTAGLQLPAANVAAVNIGTYIATPLPTSIFGTAAHHGVGGLNVPAHPQTQCFFHVPRISPQPEVLSRWLTMTEKTVHYDDILSCSYSNLGAGATLSNFVISQGVQNAKGLLVLCHINAASNGNITQAMSPFDTAPSTTAPICLSQFQCTVGGQPIFASGPVNYDSDLFLQQLSGANSINAGKVMGLTSGMLSKAEYEFGCYKYIYVDLTRRPTDSMVPLSIAISGTNPSLLAIDVWCFTILNKSITINPLTGQLLATSAV